MSLATVETVWRRAARALRDWLLAGRPDPWAAPPVPEPPVVRVPAVWSPLEVALRRGEIMLRARDDELCVLLAPGEARDLGRSLLAAAEELEVTSA